MKIDAYASNHQYWRHIKPIWEALPEENKGTLYLTGRASIQPNRDFKKILPPKNSFNPVIVASFHDTQAVWQRPRIYIEHGAGQTYPHCPKVSQHGSYSGGVGHDGTILFLCPREGVAQRWRRTYPDVPSVTVGAPVLDPWLTRSRPRGAGTGLVALAFHWDGIHWCNEMASAFKEYVPYLGLLSKFYKVIGHGHPRAINRFKPHYHKAGIPIEDDVDVVFDQADLLISDNSSIAMEFAATDRPIVWVDSRHYRPHVKHGGRFGEWDHIGPVCPHPRLINDYVSMGFDGVSYRPIREKIVHQVYTYLDGSSTERAVRAILGVLDKETISAARHVAR